MSFWKNFFLIMAIALLATPAMAVNKMPGKGVKVQPARATWNTGFFQEAILRQAMGDLGYKVKKAKDLANPIFYKSVSLGDLDYWLVSKP